MKAFKLSKEDNFMKPIILIKHEKTELLTNSSLMLIKGEVGSGKSRLAMNMMLGLLTGKEDLELEYEVCPSDKYVVYISTEMSKYHLQRRLLKVLSKVPENKHDQLIFLDSVNVSIEDKLKDLQEIVQTYPPHVIIIDQLADFVANINEIEQSSKLINSLMNGLEKSDCAIIGIVHQNEDSGLDSKARGHLGSMLEQKVVSSLAISDTRKGFTIKSTKVREGKQLNIKAIFNEQTEMLIKKEDKAFDLTTLTYPISREQLITTLNTANDCADRTSANIIAKYIEEGILTSFREGKFTKYKLNINTHENQC